MKFPHITPCVSSNKVLCCTNDGEIIFHGPKRHYVPSLTLENKLMLRRVIHHIIIVQSVSIESQHKAHCDESRAVGRFKFLLRRSVYTNDVDKINFVEWKNPQIIIEKQQLPLSSSHAICSHDGLVLLYTHKAYDTFVLWNPSIR
ncbi:hypothetical protein H5410_042913 [Solanum commersonii]|uniref:Uncharacterized protein n=1 Tax=Solanum commersonii TaxID=4109 RepID=A0A9J5XXQ4_SOLCO|nr:hypothetical protein H5410_042913 [Solanum commersonii]